MTPSRGAAFCLLNSPQRGLVSVARVVNVSAGDIALVQAGQLSPGDGVSIEGPALPAPLPARVVHAAPQPNGRWFLGCVFLSRLSESQVQALR